MYANFIATHIYVWMWTLPLEGTGSSDLFFLFKRVFNTGNLRNNPGLILSKTTQLIANSLVSSVRFSPFFSQTFSYVLCAEAWCLVWLVCALTCSKVMFFVWFQVRSLLTLQRQVSVKYSWAIFRCPTCVVLFGVIYALLTHMRIVDMWKRGFRRDL